MLEQTSSVRLTETEEKWKSHLGALRTRIDKLSHERRIILDQVSEANHAPTPDDIYHYLLSSYVHMTNNRLGISIPEEIYIAYLLKRTLMDGTQRQEEEVTSR
jgi:Lantibiotic biosynthesis dehydratase C-term